MSEPLQALLCGVALSLFMILFGVFVGLQNRYSERFRQRWFTYWKVKDPVLGWVMALVGVVFMVLSVYIFCKGT